MAQVYWYCFPIGSSMLILLSYWFKYVDTASLLVQVCRDYFPIGSSILILLSYWFKYVDAAFLLVPRFIARIFPLLNLEMKLQMKFPYSVFIFIAVVVVEYIRMKTSNLSYIFVHIIIKEFWKSPTTKKKNLNLAILSIFFRPKIKRSYHLLVFNGTHNNKRI